MAVEGGIQESEHGQAEAISCSIACGQSESSAEARGPEVMCVLRGSSSTPLNTSKGLSW